VDAAHHLRGDGEKLRAVLPVRGLCQDTRWSLERKQFPAVVASK
jgi:hypothetical protein